MASPDMSFSETISTISQLLDENSFYWSDSEKKSLDEIQEYHAKMIEAVAKAKTQGPIELPKKPKRKLLDLFRDKQGKSKKAKKEMTLTELNEYLKSKLIDPNLDSNRSFFVHLETKITGENMVELLGKGYSYIKRQNAETLLFYLQYGKLLNTAYYLFHQQKKEHNITANWNDWLKENVGISTSFARKLRDLALIINPTIYPQFLRLGINFAETYRLKNQIKKMLANAELAQEWKAELNIPDAQVSSQEAI